MVPRRLTNVRGDEAEEAKMKSIGDTLSNIATIAACLVIIGVGAPQVKERWFGNTNRPSAIEHLQNIRLTMPRLTAKGNPKSTLAFIEFSDFQCPYCGEYARETGKVIQTDYVDTGKMVYAFRNYPLTQIHPFALNAGRASLCAGGQHKFWPMHDRLFADQKSLDDRSLEHHAGEIGLDPSAFSACVKAASGDAMGEDLAEAKLVDINSTPSFVIGKLMPDGTIIAMAKLKGVQPIAVFRTAVEEALASVARSQKS
jgi:protein-disulfide isomerase